MPWLNMVKPPKTQTLPDVLTVEDIAHIIHCTLERRYQVFWLTTYSMGLRLGESLKLEFADIDSTRMRIHVRLAKGNKDRFVVLPAIPPSSAASRRRGASTQGGGDAGRNWAKEHVPAELVHSRRLREHRLDVADCIRVLRSLDERLEEHATHSGWPDRVPGNRHRGIAIGGPERAKAYS